MSEPVTSSTLEKVQVFWRLEKSLAQRKHFPAVNWLLSYSRYDQCLDEFYEKLDPEFLSLRDKMRTIFQGEEDLMEIVQLVGRESLGEGDKLVIDMAKLIREDFLQQSSDSASVDKFCPLYKTTWMLRNFVSFYNFSQEALTLESFAPSSSSSSTTTTSSSRSSSLVPPSSPDSDAPIGVTWSKIKQESHRILGKLSNMKFRDPALGEDANVRYFQTLFDEIVDNFHQIDENA